MCTQQPQANVQRNLLHGRFNKINDCVDDDDDVVGSRTLYGQFVVENVCVCGLLEATLYYYAKQCIWLIQ